MIRAISGFVESGVELLEAEGRLASVHAIRLITLAIVTAALALVGFAAVLCIGAGVVILLSEPLGLGPALVVTGIGAALLCAATMAWAQHGLTASD